MVLHSGFEADAPRYKIADNRLSHITPIRGTSKQYTRTDNTAIYGMHIDHQLEHIQFSQNIL